MELQGGCIKVVREWNGIEREFAGVGNNDSEGDALRDVVGKLGRRNTVLGDGERRSENPIRSGVALFAKIRAKCAGVGAGGIEFGSPSG